MSKAVDDRIVSLEFDNKEFEKNVDQTLKMLETLKKSLNFDKAATNFSAISEAGKKVDLSSIGESVDKLSDKFSTMRLVGLMALSNIVDGAMQMAKKVGSLLMAPFNQIKSGGWSRAMNIENAKFQIEGLKASWDELYDDIDYAVSGTAYGFDAAAKAAAQLTASGIKSGDAMKGALRGISGVAAMANSSYEEISPIFTTVAGQGKLMTMQLRQLESRGINAAATLGQQLHKSEAEIRDMVSKGKIDFDTFAKAMDDAFGEHAKDANKTFNGALSNVKAALSRIGAEFATPLIHDAIPVLNSIRLMINAIKSNMGGIFELFSKVTHIIGTNLTARIDEVTKKVGYFGQNALPGITNALKILFVGLTRIAKTISEVYKQVFGNGNSATFKYRQLGDSIQHIAEVLYPTDEALRGFAEILKIVFKAIKLVGQAVSFLVKNVGGPLLTVFVKVLKVVLILVGKLGNLVETVISVIRNLNNFDAIIRTLKDHGIDLTDKVEKLRTAYNKLKDILQKVGSVAKTALRYIAIGIAAIVATPIYLLYEGFKKLTTMDWSKFLRAIENAKKLLIELFNKFKNLEIVQKILNGIQIAFTAIVGGIMYLGSAIAEFFNKLANGEITLDSVKEKIKSIPDTLKDVGSRISNFFSGNRFFGAIGSGFGAIGKRIVAFVEGFKKTISELTPAKVMLIAFSASMIMLSINANRLTSSFLKMFDSAKESLESLTKYFTKQKTPLEKFKEAVLTTVTAIGALTAAFIILSKIPNLKEVAITLGIFIGAMAGIGILVSILDKVLKLDKGFKEFSQNMALLSLGVAAAAGALLILSKVPLEGIWKKVGVLTVIIGELAVASILMAKFGPSGLKGLLGMVGFAIALLAAGKALKNLDQVDFTKIQGSWKEIAAVLIGVAVFAKAISSIGIAVFTGAIAFLLAFKMITSKMEEIAKKSADSSQNIVSITDLVKDAFIKVIDDIKAIGKGIWEGFKNLSIVGKAIAIALVGGGIFAIVKFVTFFITKLGPGILDLSKNGKYIKRAAVSFVVIAAAIAGLVVLAKYISDCVKSNPNLLRDIGIVLLYVSGLIGMVGLLMHLSKDADPSALKAARKMFGSLGLVILSMAAFMAIAGDLKEEEFNRAKKALLSSLVVIGIFATVISYISGKFSESSKAGFGTFAGITLLFSAMMGSLAMLMLMLKGPEDYVKLAAGVIAIIGVFFAMSKLMESIAKIKYKATPKAIWALIGGIILIGGAVTLLAKGLPDSNYVGKVASISVAMVGIMSALVVMAGAIQHFAKSTKFSVTKTSHKTIMEALKVLAVLVGAIFVTATSLSLLKDADPAQLLATSGVILLVITSLTAMSLGISMLAKKLKIGNTTSLLLQLGGLTIIFAALAGVMVLISKFGGDAGVMLRNSQVIMLVLLELSGILALLNVIAMIPGSGAGVLLQLAGLTAIFTALSFVMVILAKIGGDAKIMLKNSQVIILVLVELAAILALLNVIALIPGTSAGVLLQLAGLTIIFTILAAVMVLIAKVGGNAKTMLKNSQVIMLVLVELTAILALLSAIALIPGTAAGAVVQLAGLTLVFGALGIMLAVLNKLQIGPEVMQKVHMIGDVMLSLIFLLGIMTLLSGSAIGAAVGIIGMAALIAELYGLVQVLKQIQNIDTNAVSEGLGAVAQALDLLATGAAAAALLAPGILVLSAAIIALGIGCLAAGGGVLLFASGIEKLANTTPTQLNQMIVTVRAFFVTIGQSISVGMKAITQGVIDSLTALRLAAVIIARGFFPDLIAALFSGASGTASAAAQSGAMVSQAWVNGFRIPVGWHSPPAIIIKFFQDTINAVVHEGVPLSQAMAENGKIAAASFAQEFSGYDISSITQGAGLSAISGLTEGVNAGQPGLLAEVNETLGIMSLMGQGAASYNQTLDEFRYQLVTNVTTAQKAYSAAANACDRDASGATISQKKYNESVAEAKKNFTEATDKLNKYDESQKKAKTGATDLSDALKGLGSSAGGAGSKMKDLQSSLQSTLESQMNIFSKFEQKAAMSKEELLNNMRSQIEGMTNWAAQMQQLATMGIDKGLYQKLAEMGPQGAEYVGAFASMTAEELQQANLLWAQSLVLPGQAAAMVTGSFNSIGTNMQTGVQKGWSKEQAITNDMIKKDGTEWIDTAKDATGVQSPSWKMEEIGEYLIIGLENGIKARSHIPVNLLRHLAADMLSSFRSSIKSSDFYEIGANVTEGLVRGMESKLDAVRDVASKLSDAAKTITNKGNLDENSPSKAFFKIGAYVTDGLANGMTDHIYKVEDAASDLSDSALEAMRYTVANIAAMINSEMEDPVITPILDLSNVQAGVRTLNNVLAGNKILSTGVTEEMLQNGKSPIGGTTFIQNNYSPKALSRADIYRQTRNQFAQYKQQMG